MDNNEIKLKLFAHDLTGFVRNNYSLTRFLDVVERFRKYSGLKVKEEKKRYCYKVIVPKLQHLIALSPRAILCSKNRSKYLECISHMING